MLEKLFYCDRLSRISGKFSNVISYLKMKKLVSVIIPTFNRATFLSKALDSVFAQSYQDIEVIVVDDGSQDGTPEIVERYAAEHGGRLISLYQENRGPAAARNRGIRQARSDLLAFLDSDDRFAGKKLAVQVKVMENRDFLVSHTDEVWYRRGRVLNPKKKHRKAGGDIFAQSLELCAVGMSTVMVRRELFDLVGYFDENLPCCEDYDLWLRVSAVQPFLFIGLPLTVKDGGRPDQLSQIYSVGMDRFRIAAIEKILAAGVLQSGQAELAIAELARKCRIYGTGCLKHGRIEEGDYYLNLPLKYQEGI